MFIIESNNDADDYYHSPKCVSIHRRNTVLLKYVWRLNLPLRPNCEAILKQIKFSLTILLKIQWIVFLECNVNVCYINFSKIKFRQWNRCGIVEMRTGRHLLAGCPIKTLFVMHPSHCKVFGGGMHRIKATSASECRFNCQISRALAQHYWKIMA